MRSLFGDYRAQMDAEWREALRALKAGEELESDRFSTLTSREKLSSAGLVWEEMGSEEKCKQGESMYLLGDRGPHLVLLWGWGKTSSSALA